MSRHRLLPHQPPLIRRRSRRIIINHRIRIAFPPHLAPEPRQQHPLSINHKQPIAIARVEQIDLLERAPAGFGIYEPDDDGEPDVQHEEYHVGFPADVGDGHGRDLHDHVIEDPVACRGEGGGVGSVAEGHNFGGLLGRVLVGRACVVLSIAD